MYRTGMGVGRYTAVLLGLVRGPYSPLLAVFLGFVALAFIFSLPMCVSNLPGLSHMHTIMEFRVHTRELE